ncbi:MAG: aminotransferase class V-fold PLP-dependent enzyme [Bacteroidales bacterium]|nr:aminotransferase class V-fold PLP-dependent enzyme [Bacteroidales bacterium]
MEAPDLDYIRKQFPALQDGYVFFDNAGGSQTLKHCAEKISDYLLHTNVQLGASYTVSALSGRRVASAKQQLAGWINASDPVEVAPGPSTTQLLQNLARSFVKTLKPGDEVIVTNCDHEANIGPWMNLREKGITVKIWKINRDDLRLHTDDLERLMTGKTRLVAFTHVSNILGTIHPVKEITAFVHERGALVCIDGVAFAPHRQVDVQDLDVDFYVFSFYKVFGPHYSILYAKREHLEKLPGINHYFIGEEDLPYKLQPGNVNFELTWALTGVPDYFNELYSAHFGENEKPAFQKNSAVFDLLSAHEEKLAGGLLNFLAGNPKVEIIGEGRADRSVRVPTISFVHKNIKSSDIPVKVDPHGIGIRYGDFYARRLIEYLGLGPKGGVVRVSMVHYNTPEEVSRLCRIFSELL